MPDAWNVTGLRALSVRQPWASLIVAGEKDVENRAWRYPPRFRGPLLIHASSWWSFRQVRATMDHLYDCLLVPYIVTDEELRALPRGALIGQVTVTDARRLGPNEKSPWAASEGIGLFFSDPVRFRKPVPFRDPVPCKGALGFFRPPLQLDEENA
jgi:hypothetical protein